MKYIEEQLLKALARCRVMSECQVSAQTAKTVLQRACNHGWKVEDDLVTTAIIVADAITFRDDQINILVDKNLALRNEQKKLLQEKALWGKYYSPCNVEGTNNWNTGSGMDWLDVPKPKEWITEFRIKGVKGNWQKSNDPGVSGVFPSSEAAQAAVDDDAKKNSCLVRRVRRIDTE